MVDTENVRSNVNQVNGAIGGSINQVDMMVSQVVEQHLAGCHLVLATTTEPTLVFSLILR